MRFADAHRARAAASEGPARLVAQAVPAVVDELITTKSGRLYREAILLLERPLLAHVLAMTNGNQLRAARLLGLNRNTLRKRCRELKLDGPRPASPSARAASAGGASDGAPADGAPDRTISGA